MRFLLALLLATPLAAQETPYDGNYRPLYDSGTWDCKSVGQDGGALRIGAGKFFGVESTCSLRNATNVRDMDATLYDMTCEGEGDVWTRRVMIMEREGGIAMIYDGGIFSPLDRCGE